MKKTISGILFLVMIMALVLLTAGCSKTKAPNTAAPDLSNFDTVIQNARGTTVNFYSWSGDDRINKWIDTALATYVKDNYDITLKRIPVEDTEDAVTKITDEKQAGVQNGSVDLVWINGDNFYTAKQNNLLYGPFAQYLPNYQKYIDQNSNAMNFDFGTPVDGFESPYAQAEFVLINDSAVTPETPKNAQELLAFAEKYKGKVTYPAPPDFTGSAFVRQIIYDIVGYDKVKAAGSDKAKLAVAIQPALDYLKELKPYLWKEGKTYPSTIGQLDNMFADGESVLDMSYDPGSVAGMIIKGEFKGTARDFIFTKGMVANTSFLAIAGNAVNKDGALVVANAILSPEMQASKYDPANWGALPALDYTKLSSSEKALFDKIPLGQGVLPQNELGTKIPELPGNVVPIIDGLWQSQIPNQ
jgi:putative spermidine/putrescine transport system substrate-binding protein